MAVSILELFPDPSSVKQEPNFRRTEGLEIFHHRLCNPAGQFMRTENSHNCSQARAAAASGCLHQHKNGGGLHLSGLTAVPEPDLMGQRQPVIWRASRDTQFHGVPSPGELCVILSLQEDVKPNHTCGCRTKSLTTMEKRPYEAVRLQRKNLVRVVALE